MTVADALVGVNQLGLDTSPFIYYVEDRLPWANLCEPVFLSMTGGVLAGFTSTIIGGKLVIHSKDRDEMYRKAVELKLKHSATLYTGKIPEDEAVILPSLVFKALDGREYVVDPLPRDLSEVTYLASADTMLESLT